MNIIIQIVIAIVLSLIAYALTPKPKTPKPDVAKDIEGPTSEAGRPVPVVFGTITVTSPNCLWYGQAKTRVVEIKA